MNIQAANARFGDFSFDPADGRLQHLPSGRELQVRPQVARLLLALLAADGGVVTREALYRAIWDEGAVVDFEAGLAALVRELRQALEQLGGQAGLLETIPRRGYRLHAGPPSPAPDMPVGMTRRAVRRWGWPAAVIAALILAAGGWWLASRDPGAPAGRSDLAAATGARALAVLPFQAYDQAAPDGPRLELLLADAFLAELWRTELDGIELIGRATLMPYGDREDVANAVASDLGVQLLVEGSLLRGDGDWQVTARLLAMPGGRVLWSDTVAMPAGPRPAVAETVAALAASLEEAWPSLDQESATR
jgi:DNA-binding winged helix-turn-helix (wHTH) protein/TolB-like protein